MGLAAAVQLPWRPTPALIATPALPIPAAALAYDFEVYIDGMLMQRMISVTGHAETENTCDSN